MIIMNRFMNLKAEHLGLKDHGCHLHKWHPQLLLRPHCTINTLKCILFFPPFHQTFSTSKVENTVKMLYISGFSQQNIQHTHVISPTATAAVFIGEVCSTINGW